MCAEIFSFEALRKAQKNAKSEFEREHVSPYMNLHPDLFRLGDISYSEDQKDHR